MNTDTPWGRPSGPKPYQHFKGPLKPAPLVTFLSESVANAPWLIDFGAVYVNQNRVTQHDFMVGEDDVIRVHTAPKRYAVDRSAIRARVVAETEDYLVIDKPSGLPMHPTLDNLHENLLCAFDFPLHVTHRLDVPTSGLVVVAKTKEYQCLFNRLVSQRKITKFYGATVERAVPTGELVHYMENSVKAPKVLHREKKNTNDLECRLIVQSCSPCDPEDLFKLSIELLTGRTHQIRCQLAFEGAPVVGDEMYGGKANPFFGLRASFLSFICPRELKTLSFRLTS